MYYKAIGEYGVHITNWSEMNHHFVNHSKEFLISNQTDAKGSIKSNKSIVLETNSLLYIRACCWWRNSKCAKSLMHLHIGVNWGAPFRALVHGGPWCRLKSSNKKSWLLWFGFRVIDIGPERTVMQLSLWIQPNVTACCVTSVPC